MWKVGASSCSKCLYCRTIYQEKMEMQTTHDADVAPIKYIACSRDGGPPNKVMPHIYRFRRIVRATARGMIMMCLIFRGPRIIYETGGHQAPSDQPRPAPSRRLEGKRETIQKNKRLHLSFSIAVAPPSVSHSLQG